MEPNTDWKQPATEQSHPGSGRNWWFGRRKHGASWGPITWQGWLISLVILAAIAAASFVVK